MDDIAPHVRAIEERVAFLVAIIEKSNHIVEGLVTKRKQEETAYEFSKSEHEKKSIELDKELDSLAVSLVPIQDEKAKLETDVEILVQRKSDLMLANAVLEQENRDFKAYEKIAQAALEAKESELEAKENQLNQKLGLQPKTRILPPR